MQERRRTLGQGRLCDVDFGHGFWTRRGPMARRLRQLSLNDANGFGQPVTRQDLTAAHLTASRRVGTGLTLCRTALPKVDSDRQGELRACWRTAWWLRRAVPDQCVGVAERLEPGAGEDG